MLVSLVDTFFKIRWSDQPGVSTFNFIYDSVPINFAVSAKRGIVLIPPYQFSWDKVLNCVLSHCSLLSMLLKSHEPGVRIFVLNPFQVLFILFFAMCNPRPNAIGQHNNMAAR